MIEGWKLQPLGDLVRIASGQVDPKDIEISRKLSVGPDNLRSGGGLETASVRTAGELEQISGKYAFDRNAILYSKIRPNLNKIALVDFDGICSADMYPIWVRDDRQAVRDFIFYVMNSERFVADATSRSFRTGLPKINRPDLESIEIHLPPLPEQRKIAEILRTWDEAIEKAYQLISLRQVQYLGLRERLINWSADPHKRLRSLVEPVSRAVPRPKEPYRALSIRSHGKGTFIRMVDDPASVEMDTLYIARSGDLIVNITFAWEGAIALVPQEHDGCLVSHRFPTFTPISKNVSARYLRHALRTPRFTYLLVLVSPGGAGRNRVLNKSDFLDLEVPSPALAKQEMIASSLDAAEDAIVSATELRDALTRQKRGLMQKLLTGAWRVKLEGTP